MMMIRKHRMFGASAALLILAVGAVALPLMLPHHRASADAAPFALRLDCDPATAGVRSACTYPQGTAFVDVDVVFENNSSAATTIGSFNFDAISIPQPALNPKPGVDANNDTNPDLNDAAFPADFTCAYTPSTPDIDPNPDRAQSRSICFTSTNDGPTVPAGTSLRLATVHYTSSNAVSSVSLEGVQISDNLVDEVMSCSEVVQSAGDCTGATITVDTVFNTATSTPTAVTPTPLPQMTPSSSPTGGVSDVLLLNSGVCVSASIGLESVRAFTADSACNGLSVQPSLDGLVNCLRDLQSFDCRSGFSAIPTPAISTADFSSIDVDADQVHAGQVLNVIAFVTGDYPVLFSTDKGTLVDITSTSFGTDHLCYTDAPFGVGDPDCDTDSVTVGDGIVVAKILIGSDTPRGFGHVTVTQNGQSIVKEFHVAGLGASVKFTFIDGTDTVETGSTIAAMPGDTAIDSDCPLDTAAAYAPTGSPKRTRVFTQVLDDEGTPLAGIILNWNHPFRTHTLGGGIVVGPAPQGGVAYSQTPGFDFGTLGIGFPQIVCGGAEPGDLILSATTNQVSDPLEPQVYGEVTVHVAQAGTPTITATATDTPTPTFTATATATATLTPAPTNTATATNTSTSTPTPVATSTPAPARCYTARERLHIIIQVLRRMNARRRHPGYDPRYDVNNDGVLNIADILAVLAAPRCADRH